MVNQVMGPIRDLDQPQPAKMNGCIGTASSLLIEAFAFDIRTLFVLRIVLPMKDAHFLLYVANRRINTRYDDTGLGGFDSV